MHAECILSCGTYLNQYLDMPSTLINVIVIEKIETIEVSVDLTLIIDVTYTSS